MNRKTDLEHLNAYLQSELSAVETYDRVLKQLAGEPEAVFLRSCRSSHQRRVLLLRDEIHRLGGEPARVDVGAGIPPPARDAGTRAAFATLEEREEHGRHDYQRELAELTPTTRNFVVVRLLPEQQRTAETVHALEPA
jgi:hypothetical protein